jgi:hypothetical protein
MASPLHHPDHPSGPGAPAGAVQPDARPPALEALSLFLASSRQRLLWASGLIALLWLLVWWALD